MSKSMRKTLLVLSANFFFAILVTTVYAIGYEYDKANKLYPEMYYFSDAGIEVYGQRWERIAEGLILFGMVVDTGLIANWYMGKQRRGQSILGLVEKQ